MFNFRLLARDPQQPTLAEQYELIAAFNQQRNVTKDYFGVTANLFTYAAGIPATIKRQLPPEEIIGVHTDSRHS